MNWLYQQQEPISSHKLFITKSEIQVLNRVLVQWYSIESCHVHFLQTKKKKEEASPTNKKQNIYKVNQLWGQRKTTVIPCCSCSENSLSKMLYLLSDLPFFPHLLIEFIWTWWGWTISVMNIPQTIIWIILKLLCFPFQLIYEMLPSIPTFWKIDPDKTRLKKILSPV